MANSRYSKAQIWIAVVIAIAIIALLIFAFLRISQEQSKLNDLEMRINAIITITANTSADQRIIDFLKSETEIQRRFIEDQRDQLVWFIGVIGALCLFLIVFGWYSSKKDIDKRIEDQSEKLMEHAEEQKRRIRAKLREQTKKMAYAIDLTFKEQNAKQKKRIKEAIEEAIEEGLNPVRIEEQVNAYLYKILKEDESLENLKRNIIREENQEI